jgi:hypothetical protein
VQNPKIQIAKAFGKNQRLQSTGHISGAIRRQSWKIGGADSGCVGLIIGADFGHFCLFSNLFSTYHHIGRGFNAYTNGIPIDFHNGNVNIFADLKPLTEPPAQDQHGAISWIKTRYVHQKLRLSGSLCRLLDKHRRKTNAKLERIFKKTHFS